MEGKLAAAKIRLVGDALTHPNEPMWLQYYKILQDDISHLQNALQKKNIQEVRNQIVQLNSHYLIIRPAALMNRDPSAINKVDSIILFLQRQTAPNQVDMASLMNVIDQLNQSMSELFQRSDAAAYVPLFPDHKQSIWLWTLVVGLFIVTVLAYSGWRMFVFETKAFPFHRNRNKD